MLVPRFWAEASIRTRVKKRVLTVRRFGWSDESQEQAQKLAQERLELACNRLKSGEKLVRHEPKVAYNGADGMPIREEIIDTHDRAVVTRNAYGALCLNTPDVLFADVDVPTTPAGQVVWICWGFVFLVIAGVAAAAWWFRVLTPVTLAIVAGLALLIVSGPLAKALAGVLSSAGLFSNAGQRKNALERIRTYARNRPDSLLRVYETPAGFRVLAMHRTFSPDEPEVLDFFRDLGTDPVYVRMCKNQQCFRARVSPKPWRVGMTTHIKPRRGVWPVDPKHLPARQAWIREYEATSRSFASCRFVEELGSGRTHADALAVQQVHDNLCRVNAGLPIA